MGEKTDGVGGTCEMLHTVRTVSLGVGGVAGEMGGEGDKGLERGLWERAERGHSLAGSREASLALLRRTRSRKQLQTGADAWFWVKI